MKLTPEQYRRGVISWESKEPILVRTRTAASGKPTRWSDWLTEHTGSVVQSLPGTQHHLSFRPATERAFVPPDELRWEQEKGDEVVTWFFDGPLDNPPKILRRVLGPGFFHRLVVATPALSWGEEIVLREQGLLVRFVEGRLVGEKVDPISEVQIDDAGQISLTSAPMGEYVASGRFVEIIVTGDSADDAESRAHSVVGLAGLCLGGQAVGDVVFSEPYETRDGRQFGALRAGVTAKVPRSAQIQENDLFEALLSGLLKEERTARAIRIALAWYERGLRSDMPLERFFSFLVGLEVLVNSYAGEHGPTPEASEREGTFAKIRAKVAGVLDANDVTRLAERFIESSFGEKARFYSTIRGWDVGVYEEIRQLYDLRNRAVHGDPVIIGTDEARRAHELCVKLLKAELGVKVDLGWEHEPRLLGVRVKYELPTSVP